MPDAGRVITLTPWKRYGSGESAWWELRDSCRRGTALPAQKVAVSSIRNLGRKAIETFVEVLDLPPLPDEAWEVPGG